MAKERNENIIQFLKNLKPHNKNNEFELYNAIKYLKRPAKTKVKKLLREICCVCKSFKANCNKVYDNNILNFLNVACQMDLPLKIISPNETKAKDATASNAYQEKE